MKQIILNIQDNRLDNFIEYINSLDYVSVSSVNISAEQQSEAESRLIQIENGKMKTRKWDEAKNYIFKK